jgi:hypothetical protein
MLSAIDFPGATGSPFGVVFAIPIWTKTSRLLKGGKAHDDDREHTHGDQHKRDADDIGARRVPSRPSMFSIPSSLCVEAETLSAISTMILPQMPPIA